MRTIFLYLALLTSFLGFSQTTFPQQEINYSPGGKFDTIFDNYGNVYSLNDLKIDTISTNLKSIPFNTCNTGYFKLYLEEGSGFEIFDNTTSIGILHAERRAVLCKLFYDLSQFILPVNPNRNVNIYIRSFVNNTIQPPSGVNAYASSVYLLAPINSTIGGGIADNAMWQTINSGTDAFYNFFTPLTTTVGSSGFFHGIIAFNFSNPGVWHQNLTVCPNNLKDLYSTGLHEILHALGFASLINEFGLTKLGSNYPYFTRYDTFLQTLNGTNLITNSAGACGSMYNYAFNSPILTPSVLFGSSSTCQIKFGGSVNQIVYSTPPFSNGSSLSHFEDQCHNPNPLQDNSYYVMAESSINPSGGYFSHRYIKKEERKVLCDLGYRVNNVFGSASSNNNYSYQGESICGGHPQYAELYGGSQVVGVNDGITHYTSGNTYSYVISNNSPSPLFISNFLSNDYNPSQSIPQSITFECAQSVYGYGFVNNINSTTISYLPNGNGIGVDLIRYIPVVNGIKGNITYIYIYLTTPDCNSIIPCESYVRNGDFEQCTSCGILHPENSNVIQRPCWNVFSADPDLYSIQNNSCPGGMYYYPQQNLNSWNGTSTNTHFLGLYSKKNNFIDAVQNSLSSPLLPNTVYYIKFKAKVANNISGANNPTTLVLGGTISSSISSTIYYTSLPQQMQNLGSINISSNNWQDYQIVIPNNLLIQNVNYLTIINAIYMTQSLASYVLIDDLTIVEENENYFFNPPTRVCENYHLPINLNSFTNIPNATFSGNGVSGSSFNPNAVPLGSTTTITCTYTQSNGCLVQLIGLISKGYATPAFTQIAPFCSGDILSPLPTTSTNGYLGTWSPSINNTSTTTYTFTPSSNLCVLPTTMTIEVLSIACCTPANSVIDDPTNASDINFITNGQTIQVNADINIDGNFTIQNCTLRIAPNVKITINTNCSLQLNNCLLFSCKGMWEGIIVKDKSVINLNGTRIEDAKNAILSTEGGSVIVNNSIFNKNKIGLNLQNYNNYSGVSGSTFTCTALNSPTFNNYLKAPNHSEKSYYGIYLSDNNNISIGNSNVNFFNNIEIGIYALNNQEVKIQGCNFNNINTLCPVSNACTSATLKGWGIYADNVGNITIGNSTNTVLGNSFTNSYNGIGIEGCPKFAIHRNTFSNITTPAVQSGMIPIDLSTAYCISVKNYAGNTLANNVIQNNTFTTFENGLLYKNNLSNSLNINNNIWSSFNSLDATAINILDNPIQTISILKNVFNNLTTQTGKNAIKVENVSVGIGIGQSLLISQNTIRNVNRGIWITNYNSPQIIDHNSNLYSIGSAPTGTRAGIYFPATLTGATLLNANAGIHINNCPSATISNNTIERTNYTTAAPAPLAANQYDLQFGISVGSSCTGTQVSNNVIKLMGSGIYYFGNTPISLKCNNMVNNATGLWLNGQIGQQGTVSAPQDNKWTIPAGYLGVRRNGASQSPTFFTRALFNSSLPVTSSQFMPNTSGLQMNPPNAINPPFPLPTTINAANLCFISAPPPAGLVQIVNEEGEYSYLSEEELKSLDLDLYKTLKISPDFYNESTFEGQIIEEFMDSVSLSNSAKIYEYEEKLASKDTLEAKELMALFEAYSDVEQTYKSVYEIYNRSWLDGVHSFTAEDSLVLNEIAYLSPRVAGNAVYTARVLLGLMIIDTETYAAKSTQIINSNAHSYLKIFPNPSNDYFYYFLPLIEEDKGLVSIIDISGKEIQNWSADNTTNQGSLDIHNYAKGIYFFELTINGNQKMTQKLIVK